jgi:hypothetical protein
MEGKINDQSESSLFWGKEFKTTIDKNMKPARPVGAIARKIAEANERFSKVKNIEDIIPRHSSPE